MLTPATSATSLVESPAQPRLARMRAVASRIASTVSRERSCFGSFLIFPCGERMRVAIWTAPSENINTLLTFFKRDLAIYLGARFLAEMATLVQSVAIGWRIYELSGSPMALGLIGLAQWIPMFLLSLPCGELCDRVDARKVFA